MKKINRIAKKIVMNEDIAWHIFLLIGICLAVFAVILSVVITYVIFGGEPNDIQSLALPSLDQMRSEMKREKNEELNDNQGELELLLPLKEKIG